MTDEQTKAYIAGLLEERRGYEIHGRKDRLAAVDAELDRLGHKAETPAKRSTKAKPKKRTEL